MFNKGKYVPKTKPSVFQQKREAEEKEFRRYYPQIFRFNSWAEKKLIDCLRFTHFAKVEKV